MSNKDPATPAGKQVGSGQGQGEAPKRPFPKGRHPKQTPSKKQATGENEKEKDTRKGREKEYPPSDEEVSDVEEGSDVDTVVYDRCFIFYRTDDEQGFVIEVSRPFHATMLIPYRIGV